MAMWLLILRTLAPALGPAPEAATAVVDTDPGLRMRGVEAMFARFDGEASGAVERAAIAGAGDRGSAGAVLASGHRPVERRRR